MKKVIETSQAPAAIGPYSQAIQMGDWVFCSGQIPLSVETKQVVEGGVAEQAQQVLKNIDAVLRAAGVGFSNVVKTTIFLTDMNDFSIVNEIYSQYFKAPYPARSTVAVAALPRGVKVEIEVLAHR